MQSTRNTRPAQTLTCREAGHLLGVHAETVRRGIKDGSIPAIRLGDRRLVPRQWVEDALNGLRSLWQPNADGTLERHPPVDPFADVNEDGADNEAR
jgi:excisionase family DNA binding protein